MKIEGLVTNSASMFIAIQSSLICGERRLNPMKQKQTCYRLLNRKRRTMARERNSKNSSVKSHPMFMYSYHLCLSRCSSLFITGLTKLDFFRSVCLYTLISCEIVFATAVYNNLKLSLTNSKRAYFSLK